MILAVLIALAAAELFVFVLFAHDKAAARAGERRIPERTLLLAALFGGIGAWLGQQLLRHKTRKEPFRTLLGGTVILHLLALSVLVWRLWIAA